LIPPRASIDPCIDPSGVVFEGLFLFGGEFSELFLSTPSKAGNADEGIEQGGSNTAGKLPFTQYFGETTRPQTSLQIGADHPSLGGRESLRDPGVTLLLGLYEKAGAVSLNEGGLFQSPDRYFAENPRPEASEK
jgi:hypothetical protein